MDMDLVTLGFIIIPGWFCIAGFVFALIFGPHILQMYRQHAVAEKTEAWRSLAHAPIEPEALEYPQGGVQKKEKELVGVH